MATLANEPPRVAAPARRAWPTVRGHWLTGCLRGIQKDPLGFYRRAWQACGDYVRIRVLPGIPIYLLTDPAAVEHVLAKNHKNYRKPDVFNKPMRLLTGNGILTSEGDFWLRQRRLSQPAFLRNRFGQFGGHVRAGVDSLLGEWERAEDGRTIDVLPEMLRLGLRIASTSLFSTDISADADAIGRAYRIAFGYVSLKMNSPLTLPLWVPTRRNREFRRSKALLDRVIVQMIETRRRSKEQPGDVLDMLLAARDEQSGGMSDQALKDEVITLLTAGHETAGAALSWAWHLLAEHPEVQQALHDEAAKRLSGRTPTVDDLPHLPLATAVFEETLRLYPPAWGMPRQAIGADDVNGYPIPAKAFVTLSQWVTHRHPAFWCEPERFLPERFLPGAQQDRPKFAYFPFGGGPRICIGNHFAMIEGPLVLAALAQRFHFRPAPGHAVTLDPTFTLRPGTGVHLVVRKRT
jgi:cytochrome P450